MQMSLSSPTHQAHETADQTVKLGSDDHMNQDSVDALPISLLKPFQKHILVHSSTVVRGSL